MSFENRRNPSGPGGFRGRQDRPRGQSWGNQSSRGSSGSGYGGGGGGGGYGRSGGGNFNRGPGPSGNRRPQPPRKSKPKGPAPKVRVPATPGERREMLKTAAWRLSRLVHCQPAKILATDDPASLIKEPDIKARQLAKKIVRLKRGPKQSKQQQ